MKPLKAAAVLAGSMAVLGAAAPAFAGGLTPPGLNGGLESLSGQSPKAQPLNPGAQETPAKSPVVNVVKQAAEGLTGKGGPTQLLGGLPLGK
ncbi:hypothetical protein GCM10018785_18450 [Streptomyces longispororuber]|uniref:ATP-binding protein n=1 Tax=Streptomyces longispororuber TaxID=68230 RepID=A0A919DJL1_9ACTN|nr:hypothetical protein [Streptomyces longispororuber]GHE49205.1 hypothetical protein GCM10018785_18450 [Streptomyces longispororuber]